MKSEFNLPPKGESEGDTSMGILLTLLLILAYFGFIGLGAFAPAVLAQPVLAGGTTTVAVAYGLFVIGFGVALTSFYVWFANRRSA